MQGSLPHACKQAKQATSHAATAAACRRRLPDPHLAVSSAAALAASRSSRFCAHSLRSWDSERSYAARSLANLAVGGCSAKPRAPSAPPAACACWCHCTRDSSCCWARPWPCRRRCTKLIAGCGPWIPVWRAIGCCASVGCGDGPRRVGLMARCAAASVAAAASLSTSGHSLWLSCWWMCRHFMMHTVCTASQEQPAQQPALSRPCAALRLAPAGACQAG